MKTFLYVGAVLFVGSVSASAQASDTRWNTYAFLARADYISQAHWTYRLRVEVTGKPNVDSPRIFDQR